MQHLHKHLTVFEILLSLLGGVDNDKACYDLDKLVAPNLSHAALQPSS